MFVNSFLLLRSGSVALLLDVGSCLVLCFTVPLQHVVVAVAAAMAATATAAVAAAVMAASSVVVADSVLEAAHTWNWRWCETALVQRAHSTPEA